MFPWDLNLRIISGKLKGRKIRSVAGTDTRPTADRTREAIFNIISVKVRDTTVLDLFAGTGAFGIEALSRGAQSAVFIDNRPKTISVLKKNLSGLLLEHQVSVIRWDIIRNLNCLLSMPAAFDLIFMDPPYNKNMIIPVLGHLHTCQCLANGALIVVEHSNREMFSPDPWPFEITDQRKYGKTLVSFLNYVV